MFVRFGRCPLSCSWCDTPYTWDWKGQNGVVFDPKAEMRSMPVDEIAEWVNAADVPLLVITGGEPLVQRRAVTELAAAAYRSVEIETNGTMDPGEELLASPKVRFNVSPKLANSGMPFEQRIKPDVLGKLAKSDRASFKFVVTGVDDLDEVAKIVGLAGADDEDVWIMPEGRSADRLLSVASPELAAAVLERRWNLTQRLQVLVWGDERGR